MTKLHLLPNLAAVVAVVLSVPLIGHMYSNFHWINSVFVCFSAAGSMIERITVFCTSAQELQEWLENLQPFTKGGSPAGTISKVRSSNICTHKVKTVLKLDPPQSVKTDSHPDMTNSRLPVHIYSKTYTLVICFSSHVERGCQATEYGRHPDSPVPLGQPQRCQSRPPGTAKDQQALVS